MNSGQEVWESEGFRVNLPLVFCFVFLMVVRHSCDQIVPVSLSSWRLLSGVIGPLGLLLPIVDVLLSLFSLALITSLTRRQTIWILLFFHPRIPCLLLGVLVY